MRGQRNPGGGREEATVHALGGWVVVLWTEAILHPLSVKYYDRNRVMTSFWLKALRVSRSKRTARVMQPPWCCVRFSTSIGCIQAERHRLNCEGDAFLIKESEAVLVACQPVRATSSPPILTKSLNECVKTRPNPFWTRTIKSLVRRVSSHTFWGTDPRVAWAAYFSPNLTDFQWPSPAAIQQSLCFYV